LTGGSDRCATTQSGDFEAEDTRRDRKACVEAKQVAVDVHPSDGAITKVSDFALEGYVSLSGTALGVPFNNREIPT
jgi:hypothetical protein